MAEFKGFRCDGECGEVYPNDQKNEVIVRFVGPQFSGEVTKEYCSKDVAAEAKKVGPLAPLKRRHHTAPSASAPSDPTPTGGALPSSPGGASAQA